MPVLFTRVETVAVLAAVFLLSSCASLKQVASPEVEYSSSAANAKTLQVPPDLTNISDGEQFVLPGTAGTAVRRNTLLPEFSSATYVRQGARNWLEVSYSPEQVWPKLLAFLRKQKFSVEQTQPVAGILTTQWRADGDVQSTGLLQNLIGKEDTWTRVAFRMERNGSGSRLFARSQVHTGDPAAADKTPVWPASSHDPEQVSGLLMQLLAFLGVDEQRARGILSESDASAVLDNAVIQTTAGGSQMVVHSGFKPSLDAVDAAAQRLNYAIRNRNDGLGVLEIVESGEAMPIVVRVEPLHVSAVRVSLSDTDGKRLPVDRERLVLDALYGELI